MSSCFQASADRTSRRQLVDALAAFARSAFRRKLRHRDAHRHPLRPRRMLEASRLAPQVEKFLVAESTLTFHLGEKPPPQRGAASRVNRAELAQKPLAWSPDELRRTAGRLRHGDGLAVRCVETHQRARPSGSFRVAADGDIALLSDVDEIAKPAALALLTVPAVWRQRHGATRSCSSRSTTSLASSLSKSRWTGCMRTRDFYALSSKIEDANGAAQWRRSSRAAGGWHFSSFGTPQERSFDVGTRQPVRRGPVPGLALARATRALRARLLRGV